MYKILIAFVILSSNIFASDFVKGKGKFISKEGDKLSFVKEQLLHQAFLDIVSKSMVNLGLDNDLFWKNYNEALNRRVTKYEEEITLKYEKEEKDLAKMKDEIRYRKLSFIRRFGKINSLIQSYSVKSMTRSSNNPNYRYITVEAKINKNNLSRLYSKYTSNQSSSLVDSLVINVDFSNKLFNYSDIGVDKDSDFTSVIEDNWKTWFKENKSVNIKSVESVDESEAEELEKVAGISEDFPQKYENSLYLKIAVNMKKIASSQELRTFSFYFQVNGFLLDIKSNKVLKSFTIEESDKSYSNIDLEKFSSVLANFIYRMPMGEFSSISRSLKSLRTSQNQFDINFINYKNLSQVNSFKAKIEQRGIKYSLNSKFTKVSPNFLSLQTSSSALLPELIALVKTLFRGKNGTNVEFIESSAGLSIKFK